MNPVHAVLAFAATMRLTRLVITDELGERLVQQPADRWVDAAPTVRQAGTVTDRVWLRDGLVCPYCVGFWIGLGVLATEPAWGRLKPARVVVSALALNEFAAWLGGKLGDYGRDPADD